jgi:hypothetical protein
MLAENTRISGQEYLGFRIAFQAVMDFVSQDINRDWMLSPENPTVMCNHKDDGVVCIRVWCQDGVIDLGQIRGAKPRQSICQHESEPEDRKQSSAYGYKRSAIYAAKKLRWSHTLVAHLFT